MEKTEKFPSSMGSVIKLILVKWAFFILLCIILIVIGILFEVLTGRIHNEDFNLFSHGFVRILLESLTFICLLFYVAKKPSRTYQDIFRFTSFKKSILIPLVVLILGQGILLSQIDNLFRHTISIPDFFTPVLIELLQDGVYGFLSLVLLAPLIEEVIFRGVILEGLLSRYNDGKAVVLSSLVFSICHVNPFQLFPAFVYGMLLGYLFIKTRSLIPCIIAHAWINGIGWAVQFLPDLIPGFTGDPLGEPQFQPLWFNVVGITLFVAGLLWLKKVADSKTEYQPIESVN